MKEIAKMDVDDYHFCNLLRMEPVARIPDEDLLLSEVAIMSGGRDQSGRPLVTFPAQNHGILESRVMGSGLDRILRYYINVTSPTTKVHGFAFIADLRFSSVDFISMLKSSLNSLQAETTSVVGPFVLYLIQPINKKSLKDTQTLLALRQSKKKVNKHIPATLFQTIMVVDEMDLYNYVDKSQLTADLGGYLQYSHTAWVLFRKTVEPFFLGYEELIPKLPDAFSRLDELESFDLGETREDMERQRENVEHLLRDLFRELGLDTLSHQCNDLLTKISQSDSDEVFAAVAQKPVFREVRLLAEYCREKLTMIEQRLDAARERVRGPLTEQMKCINVLDDVTTLSDWLLNEGPSGLKRLEIADSLGRAEMLCNHFETGVASLAVEKLALSDSLQEQVQTLIKDDGNGVANLKSAVRELEDHAEKYQTMLDDRRQLLSTVRNFYSLYDKIARWCVRALKFLPSDIVELHNDIQSERNSSRRCKDVGDVEYQWIEDVERFFRRHRSPKEEDVMTMMEYVETIGERVRKKKAKHLAHRLNILLHVLNTNTLASEKDVLMAVKWKADIVGSHDDGHRDRRKGGVRERKDGDGVEEPRMEEEKSEMESEVDDPLIRKIGRHTPSKEVEVGGERSRRKSSGGKGDRNWDERGGSNEEKRRPSKEESQEERKSSDSEKRRTKPREEQKNDEVKDEQREDDGMKKGRDERRNERDQSQWMRPSQDFWAGRIPGVVRPSQAQRDEMDGKTGQLYDNNGMVGYNYGDVRMQQQGDHRHLPAFQQPGAYVNTPHLGASSPGAIPTYLNRNQNANPSPSFDHPLFPPNGNAMSPQLLSQSQIAVNQSHPVNIQTGQSQFIPAGFSQLPHSIQSPHGDIRAGQLPQILPSSAGHTCTLYDPVTGLPYQEYIHSPRSESLQQDSQAIGYLSDSHHSSAGIGRSRTQRPVDHHVSGMQALHALVGQHQDGVTAQDRIRRLNIGLSTSAQEEHSRSRSSTPLSQNKRELSPYEDVLNRIGQMRTRARRGKAGHREKSKPKSADIRAAKSVPNLSNLLAGVNVSSNGSAYAGPELDGDRQSDYYARLAHLDDQTARRSSEHATKKWVSRLMSDELHYAESSSFRSASPALSTGNIKNGHRPLTPQEKYELESLTSLLNESDDENDDSAPISNSPGRDKFRTGVQTTSHKQRRVLPGQSQDIDFEAEQRELDQIRQNLSGSYAGQTNTDLTFGSMPSTNFSPTEHHTSLSSNEISPLGYPSLHSTQTHPHSTNPSSHPAYHPANHSSASGSPPFASQSHSQTTPFHMRGSESNLSSGGVEGSKLAPMTEQLREYFGDVGDTDSELMQHGLEERLRNVQLSQVQERVTHETLSTPNFLAEAMNTLVKLDSVNSQLPGDLPLEANRHLLQRNPSLQLSDEGVIIDGASWDGTLDAGSAATTERGSVESGVGSRGQASNL